MFRFFLSFLLTVVVARWMYAEVQMMLPGAVPVIDYALDRIEIPTHDRWDLEALSGWAQDVSAKAGSFDSFVQPAHAAELDSVKSYGRPILNRIPGRSDCFSGACETF